jgi:hypothetical protein
MITLRKNGIRDRDHEKNRDSVIGRLTTSSNNEKSQMVRILEYRLSAK